MIVEEIQQKLEELWAEHSKTQFRANLDRDLNTLQRFQGVLEGHFTLCWGFFPKSGITTFIFEGPNPIDMRNFTNKVAWRFRGSAGTWEVERVQ